MNYSMTNIKLKQLLLLKLILSKTKKRKLSFLCSIPRVLSIRLQVFSEKMLTPAGSELYQLGLQPISNQFIIEWEPSETKIVESFHELQALF